MSRVVFTDGSALRNGQWDAKGGWAFVYKLNGQIIHQHAYETSGKQTNNRFELLAILKSIWDAHDDKIRKLTVRTDSTYAIDCITKFFWHWRKNGWKTCARTPVKNRELIEDIRRMMSVFEAKEGYIRFEHVRAHKTNDLNNRADKLAKLSAYENPIHDYQQYRKKYRDIPSQLLELKYNSCPP